MKLTRNVSFHVTDHSSVCMWNLYNFILRRLNPSYCHVGLSILADNWFWCFRNYLNYVVEELKDPYKFVICFL